MVEQLVGDAGDDLLKKLGEKALITAVTTLITESVKAIVEVKKKARLRKDEAAFEADKDAAGGAPSTDPVDEAGNAPAPIDEDGPVDEVAGPSRVPSFERYVASRR